MNETLCQVGPHIDPSHDYGLIGSRHPCGPFVLVCRKCGHEIERGAPPEKPYE